MATIVCLECEGLFSEYAACCPNCGCPIEIVKEKRQAMVEKFKKEKEDIKIRCQSDPNFSMQNFLQNSPNRPLAMETSEICSILNKIGIATLDELCEWSFQLEHTEKDSLLHALDGLIERHAVKEIYADGKIYYLRTRDEGDRYFEAEIAELDTKRRKIQADIDDLQRKIFSSKSPRAPVKRDASVIKRGLAGTIIGGPAGGIIGALSAVDKNNRNT